MAHFHPTELLEYYMTKNRLAEDFAKWLAEAFNCRVTITVDSGKDGSHTFISNASGLREKMK